MITLCLSDYVSNSLGYVLYRYGNFYLRHTLTESDLPFDVQHFLKMDNYPEIAAGNSTGVLDLVMYATERPTLHTDKNRIKGHFRGTVEVRTRLQTGKMTTLLTLDAVMYIINSSIGSGKNRVPVLRLVSKPVSDVAPIN
ncbi:hypothetical protein LSH36_234g00037 [Paralvinella palmiformis]|uniref:Uncharacterized protein n=1 Tax=Paralvinella palmiformis TaxID=53620 RepID=A0AAD9JPB1_9ANNE|nr:hypothetical protein LSH36_234g00037 [Paralvinella palmiformis]